MRLIVLTYLVVLGLGYYATYHIAKDHDLQWYIYFVASDLSKFLIALGLMVVTRKTRNFPFAAIIGSVCTYELATQVFDINQKGNWAEALYIILIVLSFVYFFVKLYHDARANH